MKEAITVCSFCGCGCGIYLSSENGEVNTIIPSLANPVSRGSLCFKGWQIANVYLNANRIKRPLIKSNDRFQEASFEEAFALIGDRFKSLKDKEKSLGIIGSAKTTNEENYLLNRFARQILGTNNIDSSFTLHFSSLLGNIEKLPFSLSLTDIEKSDLLMVVGSNLHVEAPQVLRRVLRALEKNAKVIVINSLQVPLLELAHLSLQPLPDEYHSILSDLGTMIAQPAKAHRPSQDAKKLSEIASGYKKAKSPVVICGEDIFKGVNARDNVSLLVDLFPNRFFPLLPINNALGALFFGVTPYIKTEDFSKKWQGPLPKSNGLNTIEMVKAALQGSLKCLYVVGEDILLSMGDYNNTRKALENLEFLVVQDLFLSETAKLADVVLPACSSLEKKGTYLNMEGRAQHFEQAVEPVGESKPDWQILLELSKKFEHPLPYKNLDEIIEEVAELQLSKDRKVENNEIPMANEKTNKEFPLWLKVDNSRLIFHTGSLLKNAYILNRELETSVILVNAEYAKENQIQNNEKVKIISRTGEITKNVLLSNDIPKEIIVIRSNLTDFSHAVILPIGLKWTASRLEKIK